MRIVADESLDMPIVRALRAAGRAGGSDSA
jgi:hypothetical protein